MAKTKLTYRFRLSDDEHARAWLIEYFRRPGLRVWRVAAGPVFVAIGIGMLSAAAGFTRAMGIVALVLGAWYVAKPFVQAWQVKRMRRRSGRADVELQVRVDDGGITIDDGKVRTELAWTEIASAGQGRGYVWFEIKRGHRGTIPQRAIEDLEALRGLFQRHGKWA